jgi:hypothetical protein
MAMLILRKQLNRARRSVASVKLFVSAILLVMGMSALPAAQAQTFNVLHTFSGGPDGAYPYATVTLDSAGNLYGTTYGGSTHNAYGNVYQLVRHGSNWVLNSLHTFQSGDDGQHPLAGVIFGSDGSLYGTTPYGGTGCGQLGCGTVYNLRRPARICHGVSCPWTENILYLFAGYPDGAAPQYGPLVFDAAGNIYGTTDGGGQFDDGVVYQLTKTHSGWTEGVLYNFSNGGKPVSGVTLDSAGNLYGTAPLAHYGFVYELIKAGPLWSEKTLHTFQGGDDGADPYGGLIFDAAGNAYGTTEGFPDEQRSTVFELTPEADGSWTETVLYEFPAGSFGPRANLAMDAAGNLYGSTYGLGVDRFGRVFKLTHAGGSWTYTDLYIFTNGVDGAYPIGGVTLDSEGNIYGTCVEGGSQGFGTVWQITP